MTLLEITENIPGCVAVAWVDSRSGSILRKRQLRKSQDVTAGLEAVAEIVCSPDRPRRMVLLSSSYIYVAQRPEPDSHRVLLVVCHRSANLGITVAMTVVCATDGESLT